MDKPRLYWDGRKDRPNEITNYVTCHQCFTELPPDESMATWSRLNVGLHPNGVVQVWCVRHECNVMILSPNRPDGLDYGDETPVDIANLCEHPGH